MLTSTTRRFAARARVMALAAAMFAVLGAAAAPAAVAADTYTIDLSHSNLGFSVRHFFSNVPGTFTQYEGVIVFDPQDPSKSSVNISIDAASIDTRQPNRDKHLKSPDFFDVEKFPKITYVSGKVTAAGPNKMKVDGTLTIKGISKPVTLDVTILGSGPDAWGGFRAGFEARTTVNRMDYGVSWNKVVEGGTMLGDDVAITINIEAVRQAPKPAEGEKK